MLTGLATLTLVAPLPDTAYFWAITSSPGRPNDRLQTTVSRSNAEAEYLGVANVVAEIYWVRNLLLKLGRPPGKASIVYSDNMSAIYLSSEYVQHQRTKHVEIDIHFVREKVHRGQVRVLHVPSRYQLADIFTKVLPRHHFFDFRANLSIRKPPH